jgi:serine phosphatase RsbU (regulator of sigma subunit)
MERLPSRHLISLIFKQGVMFMNFQLDYEVSLSEPKQFYKRVQMILSQLDRSGTNEWNARLFISAFQKHLFQELQISSVYLFNLTGDTLQLISSGGKMLQDLSETMNNEFGPLDTPWFGFLNNTYTAIMPFGDDPSLLVFFFPEKERDGDRFLEWAVSAIHYAIVQYFRNQKLHSALEEATAVQLSLLPSVPSVFGDFEIAAKTVPAKIVGGDVYDFQELERKSLSILIADAAGHGLPAALQARDVITGLRMGIEKEMGLTHIVEKLNSVIHRSGLVSRFISLVLADLLPDRSVFYVNAGHPAPLLYQNGNFLELSCGGMILGPLPECTYSAGYVRMYPGDTLLLYTDGVLERCSENDEEFGKERLKRWMLDWSDGPSAEAVEDLYRRLNDFNPRHPFHDDATVISIRRCGSPYGRIIL